MSYDIRLCVKIDGLDQYADIATPKCSSPTYNLRDMFVACMDWEYEQGEYYRCSDIVEKVERGIRELHINKSKYEKYNSPNGWGDISSAVEALYWLRECIYYTAEEIPIDRLYMYW